MWVGVFTYVQEYTRKAHQLPNSRARRERDVSRGGRGTSRRGFELQGGRAGCSVTWHTERHSGGTRHHQRARLPGLASSGPCQQPKPSLSPEHSPALPRADTERSVPARNSLPHTGLQDRAAKWVGDGGLTWEATGKDICLDTAF